MHTDDYGWTQEAPESSNYLNPAILSLAKRFGAKRVLDAGCGNGELAGALAATGADVTGIDTDIEGIAIAQKRFPQASFAVGSFAGAPPSSDYDLVVSTEVVEHLYSPHELPRFGFEALRPGGHIAISTPYHGYAKNLALSLVNGWDKHHTADWHGGHIKFWSRRTLEKLVRDAGFEIVDFLGVGRIPYLWKSMIVVARKPG